MKLRPTACWRMRTSPAPGAGTSTSSYTRASGPPTLCTRTALVMTVSPSVFAQAPNLDANESHRRRLVNSPGRNWLSGGLPAVASGEHIEQLDRGRKHDGKVDIAARDVEFESVRHKRHPDQHQERQRQHLGGRMIGDEFGDRPRRDIHHETGDHDR